MNTSLANRAVENSLSSRRFSFLGKRKSFLTEHMVRSYKADLYIAESNTVIEVKSVISQNETAVFPTVYSERTQRQLVQLQELLQQGFAVCFMIVSLSPYVKDIVIDDTTPFYQEFFKCIQLGMIPVAFTCRLINGKPLVDKSIPVKY